MTNHSVQNHIADDQASYSLHTLRKAVPRYGLRETHDGLTFRLKMVEIDLNMRVDER